MAIFTLTVPFKYKATKKMLKQERKARRENALECTRRRHLVPLRAHALTVRLQRS